uniref:Uncharacterized protein n=1 Tax=Parascaris equorum TaxID=6256 RepID=A0A914RH06_PAREQ
MFVIYLFSREGKEDLEGVIVHVVHQIGIMCAIPGIVLAALYH